MEDYDQLERRADEINEEIVNSTCPADNGYIKEVSLPPLPNSSPGDATVPRLLLPSLGLSAPAADQGRRSKQDRKREQWQWQWKWKSSAHPPLLGGCLQLDCSVQKPPGKGGQA